MLRGPATTPVQWRRVWPAVRLVIAGAGSALAVFHIWLFAGQIGRGELADPALAVRWLIAGGLVAAVAVLWRSGESLAGRKAIAVWALAALLHGPALADGRIGALDMPALPETVTSVLRIVTTVTGLALALLAALARRRGPAAPAFNRIARPRISVHRSDRPFRSALAPRPPPRA